MNNKTTNINIRIDNELKEESEKLFKKLGMTTSSAINMFLSQCVREQSLIFTPKIKSPKPSADLLEALNEVRQMESGKIKSKSYHNVEEMFNAICEEEDEYD